MPATDISVGRRLVPGPVGEEDGGLWEREAEGVGGFEEEEMVSHFFPESDATKRSKKCLSGLGRRDFSDLVVPSASESPGDTPAQLTPVCTCK